MLDDLKIAAVFLTRLPVRIDRAVGLRDLAAAVHMFPVVGLLVGAAGALVLAAMLGAGLPPLLAGLLALGTVALLTGALHEDGLADTADALGASDRERALEIMRDSRVGSFGALALVVSLVGRAAALAALVPTERAAAGLVAAAAVSRSAMPLVMLLQPSARASGLAAEVGRPARGRVLAGLAVAAAAAFLLVPPGQALVALVVAAVAATALATVLGRRFGGCTGDTLGAVQQTAELAFLAALVAAWR